MLRRVQIQNYKSILDDTLELGRFNVFIGENGCGKTNILEALAMAGAALRNEMDVEELFNRGIRPAKPSLTWSNFTNRASGDMIRIQLDEMAGPIEILGAEDLAGPSVFKWIVVSSAARDLKTMRVIEVLADLLGDVDPSEKKHWEGLLSTVSHASLGARHQDEGFMRALKDWQAASGALHDFIVYALSTQALRGLQFSSRREPLGLHGEGLDVALAGLSEAQRADLTERASCIGWLENIVVDEGDRLKLQGFKLGRSTSTLYFVDRFMARDNNVFSAENANEGILHVLFYLTLFLSPRTPSFFGIDNIETALNPQLCRDLIKQLVELGVKHDKQALITTHNPAVLDGLNLHDDEQRLFVVERNDEGHTKTRRIKLKPDAGDGKSYKLSELWMRGHLGGLPGGF